MTVVTGFSPDSTDRTSSVRLLARLSSSDACASHFGVGRALGFLGLVDEAAACARGMFVLLEWNGFGRAADVDFEPCRAGGNRQLLVAELPDDVKRFARRLLEGEPQLVLDDVALGFVAYVLRHLEVAVPRYEAVESLMRTLQVVVADEVLEPALRVYDVREHGTPQKLVPQRLPEALDFPERLRMLRPTTDMLHAEPLQVFFELSLAPPHRVLPTVVSQHFARCAVRRDATLESFHHERGLLMVRERVPDDVATVVIHEHAHVEALRAPQPKREDVRLPQLVR